jgi:hypothetical protein
MLSVACCAPDRRTVAVMTPEERDAAVRWPRSVPGWRAIAVLTRHLLSWIGWERSRWRSFIARMPSSPDPDSGSLQHRFTPTAVGDRRSCCWHRTYAAEAPRSPMHFANDVAAADELAFDRHRNLGGGCHGLAGRRLAWAARRSRRACPLGRTSTDIFVIGDTAFAHDAPGEPLPGMGSPLSPSSKEAMWPRPSRRM